MAYKPGWNRMEIMHSNVFTATLYMYMKAQKFYDNPKPPDPSKRALASPCSGTPKLHTCTWKLLKAKPPQCTTVRTTYRNSRSKGSFVLEELSRPIQELMRMGIENVITNNFYYMTTKHMCNLIGP